MDAAQLADLAVRDLRPLLAVDAEVVAATGRRRKRGGRSSPGNNFWVSVPGGLEVSMRRSLPATVWEASLLEPYGDALADLQGVPDAVAKNASDDLVVRAISGQVGGSLGWVVEDALRFLLRCATSTYEGQPIHMNLLVDLDPSSERPALPSLDALSKKSWYPVLGSGLQTGVLIDQSARVVRVIDVADSGASVENTLRPDSLRHLGRWTEGGRRVALSLTRTREIVIQQDGMLRYVFRSGRWRALPVEVALKSSWSSGSGVSYHLKKAILASAIDSSLGHHGGCVSVVTRGHARAFERSGAVRKADRWPKHSKSRLFGQSNFQTMSRRKRLELLSMDGATVVDHHGEILAAGAIVAVPGGSSGGGRLAATRALAQYGAAFKVSQDGPIKLFGLDVGGSVVERMTLA